MSVSASWLFLAFAAVGGPAEYPRGELLVEPADLGKIDAAKGLVILDARPRAKFEKGHHPLAVWVDHEDWSKAFGKSQDPTDWAKRIGDLGIAKDDRVIVYDDAMQKDAARIWWILRYFGHKDVRLLNGGFKAWTDLDLPVSMKELDHKSKSYTIAAPAPQRFATGEDVLKVLNDKGIQIIDARSEKEFCGEEKLKNKKGGAIPGAMHLEWTEALDKKTHRFKSAKELQEIFRAAGIDVSKRAVTHCQSGGRAAVMAFTLELMGAKEVANYYRGWSEWGNREDTPIVTPEKKSK